MTPASPAEPLASAPRAGWFAIVRWCTRPVAKLGEWSSRIRVGWRLAVGFGVTLLFVMVVGGLGIVGMQRMGERLDEVVTINNAKLGLAQSMRRALAEQEKGILLLVLATDSQQQQTMEAAIKYQAGQYDDAKTGLIDIFTLAAADSFESDILAKIKAHEAATPALVTKTVELVSNEAGEEALKLLQEKLAPAFKAWVNDLDELVSIEQRQNDAAAAAAQQDQARLRIVLLGCSAAALVLGVLMGYVIASGLLNELGGEPRQVASIAHQLASGNLAMPIVVKPGDTTSLMTAMKETVYQLSRIMRGISQASDSISTAATEIAAGNLDLSKRTEEQAAALEETSATMEELTATVRQNSDNAHKANELAVGAADVAARGGEVVGQMVDTMASIEDASKRIADIIGLIDGIAFQTNILALNAAVEAARAGEQGRGFAVVAGEVRSLAQRSAEAAKQIKSLITESVERVEGGGRLANGAGATMAEVVAAVERLTSIMAEITVASTEQSDGIAQVNVTISHMDQNTQRNAALVEEAAAAAASMQQQARNLTQLVSAFRLSSE